MLKNTRNSLTLDKRCQIFGHLSTSVSKREVAKKVGLHHSIVCREITRNKHRSNYAPEVAHKKAKKRSQQARGKPRKLVGELLNIVIEKLKQEWSPQQISGRLKLEGVQISHESIYRMIWRDKAEGGSLYCRLRHNGKKYNKRAGKNAGRGLIPGRVDISERAAIVDAKSRVGDWEADTVIGAQHKGALVTLVERHSKFALIAKVETTSKELVTTAIIKLLKPAKRFVHTITFDNGKEFAGHAEISKALGADAYFARPYHSWERGLNEHTNGLIRQYLPKGANLLDVPAKIIRAIQKRINSRPRNVLSFKTPSEVFCSALSVASTC